MRATTTLILLNMILYWTQMRFCFTSSPITMNKSKKKNLRMHGQHPAYLSIESFFFLQKCMLPEFHSCVWYTIMYLYIHHLCTSCYSYLILIKINVSINNDSGKTIREALFHGFMVSALTEKHWIILTVNIPDLPKEYHLNYQ